MQLILNNKLFKARQNRIQFNDTLQKSSKSGSLDLVNKSEYKPAIGTKVNFVLLIQFRDLKFNDNPPFKSSSDEDIINAFNDLFNN